ncbi:MAG TPA: GAF domain-containing protein [Oxalobacteraceae bacterium]|nr:GAF domain-containing protein [Oxalobacteraceae bacterium]
MDTLTLDAIRDAFDSAIPAIMATSDLEGMPNVAYLSQVQYIDSRHIALSYQFFNKTRQNILANPQARLLVVHPVTAARYCLTLRYLRTETAGALFESLKAKLAGIASHTGMSGVFRLLGADVFCVEQIKREAGATLPRSPARNLLPVLRSASVRLAACADLDQLLTETLSCLERQLDIRHAMVFMYDAMKERLYAVASRGYDTSGVGSEIALGDGVIGVAARERAPIRIGHMSAEYAYSRAIRASVRSNDPAAVLATEIPLPGLTASRSQLAVPILSGISLHGVLFVESPQELRFNYDDEDALVLLAGQLGYIMERQKHLADASDEPATPVTPAAQLQGPPLLVRHYAENDSVFFGNDYLIKGVAGSILWTLLRDHVEKKRTVFTNRELRLDARICLPDLSDNLEARLLLLTRRLHERHAAIQIRKTGRGRFELQVSQPVELVEAS